MGLFQNTNEEANSVLLSAENRSKAINYPKEREAYQTKIAKAVIIECASKLFFDSLIIENADKYKASLMPIARAQIADVLKEATDLQSLGALLENASPYIKQITPLIESVWKNHDDIIAVHEDGCKLSKRENMYCVMNESNLIIGLALAENDADAIAMFDNGTCHNLLESSNEIKKEVVKCPPYNPRVFLKKPDLELLEAYSKDQDSKLYSDAIQKTVLKVFHDEEAAAQARTEHVEAVVNSLNEIQEETIEEAVQGGMNIISKTPSSLFNSIFMNKSRAILSESASDSVDISEYNEQIMDETICTYTLLECINSLGLHNYTKDEIYHLMYEFATA